MQLGAVSHVLILLGGVVAMLVGGIFLPRRRQAWSMVALLGVLSAAAVAALVLLHSPPGPVFAATYIVDALSLQVTLLLLGSAALLALFSFPLFRHDHREAEFYVLLGFATLGGLVLAGAADLMAVMLGVLLLSVASYPLVVQRRTDAMANEAVLKYYLFGALTNVGLMYGLVLLYGLTGTTLLGEMGASLAGENTLALSVMAALLILGLGFKAGYVPGHFWMPDVYQGSTLPVAALLSVLPKLAAFAVLLRLMQGFSSAGLDWDALLAAVAAITMTWGNLAALRQSDLKRLLAYSSVAQSGYILLGVIALRESALATDAVVYYLLAYAAANIGAFAALGALGMQCVGDGAGRLRRQPLLSLALLVSLLSLVGIPPLAGFVAKFLVLAVAFETGHAWLVIVALVNTVVSLFYYLRPVVPLLQDQVAQDQKAGASAMGSVAVAAALTSVFVGVMAGVVLER